MTALRLLAVASVGIVAAVLLIALAVTYAEPIEETCLQVGGDPVLDMDGELTGCVMPPAP